MARAEALARWYAARSAVRRLWALSEGGHVRVVITLAPTQDGDDVYPAWLANAREWTRELSLRLDGPVRLEVSDGPLRGGLHGDVLADLCWRDPDQAG
jgi:hypothetical protein